MMRPKARSRRQWRLASQVQARTEQLAAGDGWNDDVLLVTHGKSLSGRPHGSQLEGQKAVTGAPRPWLLFGDMLQAPDTPRRSQQQHIRRPVGE